MKLTFLLIPMILLSSCTMNDSWQGAFYKDGNVGGKPEYSPIFTDFNSCKDWVLKQSLGGDKYTCNKNCKNIGNNDIQECEAVIRNWSINEGTITFESYKE